MVLLANAALILKVLFVISLFKTLSKVTGSIALKEVMPMVPNAIKMVTAEFLDTVVAFSISAVAGLALLT